MTAIQISPNKEDCRCEGGRIQGWMPRYEGGGILYTYQAPEHMKFKEQDRSLAIDAFRAAIALASKRYQVEDALNAHFGKIKGTFEIEDCPDNPFTHEPETAGH